MSDTVYDVAIIGGGFGGSLTALLMQRVGMRPIVIERGAHPRFAIGESSTPLANLVLADLAQRYDLPRLLPLCNYGSWKRAYPALTCGCKRGFSYFHHTEGEVYRTSPEHQTELLVAANPDTEHADTHWLRADFDAFLAGEVREAGIEFLDRTELTAIEQAGPWRLGGIRRGQTVELKASFVVDASGGGGALARALGIANDVSAIKTNSRSVFAHFRGVKPWHQVYTERGGRIDAHPFPCDDAALHHIIDGGWMWVLRFDNGVTSAGLVLDCDRYPRDASLLPADEWADLIARYPSIAAQFAEAEPVTPLVSTDRLQRRYSRVAGDDWAMLPHTACFIDPLHSAGNAHALSGIERIAAILASTDPGPERTARLGAYGEAIHREAGLLDLMIHACYRSNRRFDLMTGCAMLYFLGATFSEHRNRRGLRRPDDGFLLSHDPEFRAFVESIHDAAVGLAAGEAAPSEVRVFQNDLARAAERYNVAGLVDPAKRNMYSFE